MKDKNKDVHMSEVLKYFDDIQHYLYNLCPPPIINKISNRQQHSKHMKKTDHLSGIKK